MLYPNRPSAERIRAAAIDHRVRRNQPKPAKWFKRLMVAIRAVRGEKP